MDDGICGAMDVVESRDDVVIINVSQDVRNRPHPKYCGSSVRTATTAHGGKKTVCARTRRRLAGPGQRPHAGEASGRRVEGR